MGGVTEPTAVDVDRAALTITWDDGTTSRFDLEALRRACPCASCRAKKTGTATQPDLHIVNVTFAGAWGMTPTWSDGHNTGIYTWEYLQSRMGE
jgi:DUF971 family protein